MVIPRIFYVASDENRPSGGEIDTYDHVDALNGAGLETYALHGRPGYRHTWFDNRTRVIDMKSFWKIYAHDHDYVVLPEPVGARITMLFPGRKVIFNKNLYLGFDAFGFERQVSYPYDDETVVAVFAVSEHNLRHLRCAFPTAKVFRMFTRIDTALFGYTPLRAKGRRICCVAKAGQETSVLYHTLCARSLRGLNRLAEYEWTFLRGFPQRQVALLLRDALMLVSLSTHEGLPRTILEAMACGCLVFGHGTGPMKECLLPGSRIEPDDLVEFVRLIEDVTNTFPNNAEQWLAQVTEGRALAERFSRDNQKQHVLAAWEAILKDVRDASDVPTSIATHSAADS